MGLPVRFRGIVVGLLIIEGGGARVLVLRECIWKAAAVSLVLPAFDDTGSLLPQRRVVYHPG